jgi:hypothetical protein
VRLGRLRPDVSYRVRRLDAATEERLTGKELMSGGLLLELANKGASEILHLKAEG